MINLLYESELCDRLCEENSKVILKPVIESFYVDPDVNDRDLFIDKEKFKNIKVGLDGLCGWKILFDIYEGNPQWLEDYEAIRGPKLGYLIWPNNTKNRQYSTINQLRYLVFGDRIDYTLYDIDLFLHGKIEKCRLSKAYVGQTKEFLSDFKNIKEFSKAMNLEVFLDEEGMVKNLDEKNKILTEEQHRNFSFSSRWGAIKKKKHYHHILKILLKFTRETNFQIPICRVEVT